MGLNEEASGQIRGGAFWKAVFVGWRRTNAQVWVYETNTDWFGHVLPWLVSTYGCQRAEEGSKRHTRLLESSSAVAVAGTGRLFVDYCQDGIGKEYSCLSRSSTMLLIRHRSS